MNELLEEQLKLHFKDNYEETLRRAKAYLGSVKLNHTKWGGNVGRLINNEGTDVLNTMLCYIVEAGDITQGLQLWGKDISDEYINGNHNKWVTFGPISDKLYSSPSPLAGMVGDLASPPFGGVQHLEYTFNPATDDFLKSDEERELYQVLANVSSHLEAAELLNWDIKRVKRIYKRVHYRRRYATDAEYRKKRIQSSKRFKKVSKNPASC